MMELTHLEKQIELLKIKFKIASNIILKERLGNKLDALQEELITKKRMLAKEIIYYLNRNLVTGDARIDLAKKIIENLDEYPLWIICYFLSGCTQNKPW
jgi:hypothetical protein